MKCSERSLTDLVILGVLLKQNIGMLDGLDTLLRRGCVDPAYLQLRSMFEASIYVDWILSKDSELRASAYYVSDLRRIMVWINRYDPSTNEYRRFRESMGSISVSDAADDRVARWRQQRAEIESLLKDQRFADLNSRFEKEKASLKRESAWYVPLLAKGLKKSFYALVKELDRVDMYVTIYGPSSEMAHSANFRSHIEVADGKAIYKPLRSLLDLPKVVGLALQVQVVFYRRIIEAYRPEEVQAFAKKYVEEWRNTLLNPKSVTQPAPRRWLQL